MKNMFIVPFLIGIVLDAYIIYLVFNPPKPLSVRKHDEQNKYFDNMRWFGWKEHDIFESFQTINTYQDLVDINRKMEKTIKKHDSNYRNTANNKK